MITVLGLWELGWMEAERTERRIWKQTLQAFAVDNWGMCPPQGGVFSSPVQYADMTTMLAAHPGPKTFLVPRERVEGSTPLKDYVHPSDAIYVFGSSVENLVSHITEADDVVTIYTPALTDMFASSAMTAVLYDRLAKAG